jgi:hypothetical protein
MEKTQGKNFKDPRYMVKKEIRKKILPGKPFFKRAAGEKNVRQGFVKLLS